MPAIAAPAPRGAGPDVAELDDAREALHYWETRATALPRLAVRDRREARAMALRWRARVTDAERAAYGRGLRGALLLMVAELRLPEHTRQAGRHAAHRARQAAVVVVVAVLAVLAAMAVALVALASALVGALT
jgi:trehalose/maltose hydrolase-like predicted phosphorylase